MSSSGITNYSVTELEVIKGAAGKIGVLESGQTLDAADVEVFRRNLNMIVKQWTGQADFAPGLKMWTRRRAYLFLQDEQIQYDIGPSGDECASEEYVTTTLSAAAASTVLTVTEDPGFAVAMRIGVVGSSGTTWTTISSIAGTTLVVADSVTAASGARVFAYESKPLKPFEIVSAVLRDTDDQDSPMDPNLSLAEYELIPHKSGLGTPSRLYFEPRKDAGRVYLDASPDDLTRVVRLVFHSYIEDTTSQTQNVDFPAQWFRALVAQLAVDSALDFSRPVTPNLMQFRDESLKMAKDAHPETTTKFYASDPDWY